VVDTSPEMPGSYPVILKGLYLTHSSLDTPFLIILRSWHGNIKSTVPERIQFYSISLIWPKWLWTGQNAMEVLGTQTHAFPGINYFISVSLLASSFI
jgi:hypothetical protein